MTGFSLDTSGGVGPMPGWAKPVPTGHRFIFWSDLSPFEQGYTQPAMMDALKALRGERALRGLRFSDLAPEALETIRRDCARFAELYGEWPLADHGRGFWEGRQKNKHSPEFSPLTVTLGDDGKVRLTEARS